MPIMNDVEAKSVKGRLVLCILYTLLIVGGITMTYPFALMLSSSISSGVDSQKYNLLPKYLTNDKMLFLKYLEAKYCYNNRYLPVENLNRYWSTNVTQITEMDSEMGNELDRVMLSSDKSSQRVRDWREFSDSVPLKSRVRCFDAILNFKYADYIIRKYKTNDKVKEIFNEDIAFIRLPFVNPYKRAWSAPDTPVYREYQAFLSEIDKNKWTVPLMFDGEFTRYLRSKYSSLSTLNNEFGTKYSDFSEIILQPKAPQGKIAREWVNYVRNIIPLENCILNADRAKFMDYLQKYFRNIDELNAKLQTGYKSFSDMPGYRTVPESKALRNIWINYFTKEASPEELEVSTVDIQFRSFLANKYGNSIANLNNGWGAAFNDFSGICVPGPESDFSKFSSEKTKWKFFFIYDNYSVVWRFIAVKGNAFWNTIILCVCTIIAQLTVNPMCAYALSRYKIRNKYRLLMFFIATMAFPQMVLTIPNFVLLKELGMLNTYWALIVPSMASGYYIFLMKGFFDSLPKELYEAASIDGANEFTIFTKITLPLITPILAVKALAAFTAAYGGFMWAFIICQDPRMWTLSVYLYQFQSTNPYHLVMTSLVIASLPLLLMFIFCQNIIMKGIVIPVMK